MSIDAMLGQWNDSQATPASIADFIAESLHTIRSFTARKTKVGIILGSGLGGLAADVKHALVVPYRSIPHMPQLSAAGHAGEWIVGEFAGQGVVMMRGRAHYYEGHSPFLATYGVRLMQAMGVTHLVVSNAAGGLDPRLSVGDLVVIADHINLLYRSSLTCSDFPVADATRAGLIRRTPQVYDEGLLSLAQATASKLGFPLARGTYLATLGPTYETRAEYRAFRKMGADMVGMSTVPETMLAASLGLHVLAFSVITNVAAEQNDSSETSHAGVLEAAHSAGYHLATLLKHILPALP